MYFALFLLLLEFLFSDIDIKLKEKNRKYKVTFWNQENILTVTNLSYMCHYDTKVICLRTTSLYKTEWPQTQTKTLKPIPTDLSGGIK